MIGIYKITSPTGKVYIGQSWTIEKRRLYYQTKKCKNQRKLYHSIDKHGWSYHSFECVHELPSDVTQEVLNDYESIYIDQYKSCGFEMMNLREPGSRGKHSEETKKKMKETREKEFKENPDKYRAFLTSNSGKIRTPEERKRDSECKKGSKNPNYGRRGENHWHYGKISPKKGISATKEAVENTIKGMEYLMKPVLVFDLEGNPLGEYRSTRFAAKALGMRPDVIRNMCSGKTKRNKRYIFKYK